jgi:hypothetical protein
VTDPTALYAALATVAAITSALQGSAALGCTTRVTQLEGAFDASRPNTNERQRAKADGKGSRTGIVVLNVASAVVSAAVLVAWGDVVFGRMPCDWVFIVPWCAIGASALALSYIGIVDLWRRLNAVASGSRGSH